MEQYNWDAAPQGALDKAADAVEAVKNRTKNILRSSMNAVCIISIIALEVLRRFVTYGFNPEFAWDYVLSSLVSSLSTLVTFYVLFPSGKKARRLRQSYQEAKKMLSDALEKLRKHKWIAAFRAWCRELSNAKIKEVRDARFEALENRYVPREDYEKEYRFLSRRQLRKLVKKGTIDRAAMKQILYCNKRIKQKPFAPSYFLSGVKEGKESVYLHGKGWWETVTLAARPLTCVTMAVFTSLLTWTTKPQGNALDVCLSIAISIAQICVSALMGYSSGGAAADREELALRAKAGFVEEFNEEQEKKHAQGILPSA